MKFYFIEEILINIEEMQKYAADKSVGKAFL